MISDLQNSTWVETQNLADNVFSMSKSNNIRGTAIELPLLSY